MRKGIARSIYCCLGWHDMESESLRMVDSDVTSNKKTPSCKVDHIDMNPFSCELEVFATMASAQT